MGWVAAIRKLEIDSGGSLGTLSLERDARINQAELYKPAQIHISLIHLETTFDIAKEAVP